MGPSRALYTFTGTSVVPHYLAASDQVWLRELLDEFQRFEGRPRRALATRLEQPLLATAPREKLRLAFRIADRLWLDRPAAGQKPRVLRRALFAEAASAATHGDRERVVAEVAERFGLAPAALLESLFGDVRGERLLKAPGSEVSPGELAQRTNLALVQSLLAAARSVEIELLGNARAVVRQAQARGLLVDVRIGREETGSTGSGHADPSHLLAVAGPLALFRRTRPYGKALAGLVPQLMNCRRFRLAAWLRLPEGSGRLVVASGDPLFPGLAPQQYDSRLEERFARDFCRAAPDYDLIREPAPVRSGRSLVFPDFELRHRGSGASHLVEIVGFWTPEYLAQKLARYRAAAVENLVLCVDEDLACDEESLPRKGIILRFRRRIDPERLLALIKA